ncbi:MAG: hypothetical protein U0441_21735 [Polyangiaceae bacterium]
MGILLSELHLILPDLLTKKRHYYEHTSAGAIYIPLLEASQKAIDDLPVEITTGTVLAAELGQADVTHDGYGGAIWNFAAAYLKCPGVDEEVREAAERIRKQFIPALSQLKEPYAAEAKRAADREKTLGDHKADLQMFPVITAKGDKKSTLYDWVKAYIDAGRSLDALLSERADADYDSRAGAPALRTTILGQLGRMRTALSDEVAAKPKLSRTLVEDTFAYFDQMEAAAEKRAAGGAKKAAKNKAPTPDMNKKPEGAPAGG